VTWQPIETAPRDGSRFLFWNGEYVCVAQFVMGKFFAAQGYPANGIPEATHWMPIPTPPATKTPGREHPRYGDL
jgi:hypothetical protein